MIDVFISYKREDRAPAQHLARLLAERGYRVWWDAELLSGDNFIIEIFNILKTAKAAVVLWSEAALASRFVIGEALFALNRDIYIGASVSADLELPPPFNALHFADAVRWQADGAFDALLPAVERKAGPPATHAGAREAAARLMQAATDEALLWRQAADADTADGYARYLARYGADGTFSDLAVARKAGRETAARRRAPGAVVRAALVPALVEVPAGTFVMGSTRADPESDADEYPAHQVAIARPFALGVRPVSFDEYEAFCAATGREAPRDQGMDRGRHPVVNVTWHDAVAYCRWLSTLTGRPFRLPSEAEWEYAARAGSDTPRPWGAAWDGAFANGAVTVGRTSEPGRYPANAFGLCDMIGNVWEWCADPSHGGYWGAPADGSVWDEGGDGNARVIRGGSWDDLPQALRSAMRGWYNPAEASLRIGFRVVREG